MAVIQISKIQVRRGLQENLPQLAAGEFGWSTDTQRLYIGNGVISAPDYAPQIGNTEVITAGRDILDAIQSYTFKGTESGYTSLTGPNTLSPVQRSLQNKIDEQISVRDFGAEGDGSTDDTVAIQRAINQVFPTGQSSIGIRRVLHFPAGEYIVTSTLSVPSYASLAGDGMDSTVINGLSNSVTPVISLVDGDEPVPTHINISGITLTSNGDTVNIDSAKNIYFNYVKFSGGRDTPIDTGSLEAGVYIHDTTSGAVENIIFNNCWFERQTYGILAQNEVIGVSVRDSVFNTLFTGVLTTSNGATYPQSVKVIASSFDNVADYGVKTLGNSSVISAYNVYNTVGYGNAIVVDSGTPTSTVLYFDSPNNYSFGDLFYRTVAEQQTYSILSTGNTGPVTTAVNASGSVVDQPGHTVTLADNTSANTAVDITLTMSHPHAIIDYSITRDVYARIGTIKATQFNGLVTYEDDYSESTTLGVSLAFIGNVSANTAVLNYTTTSTGHDATFKYTIRTFS